MVDNNPEVRISRIDSETLLIPIVGVSPLIVNNFSEKARREMFEAQQGKKSPKQKRDPEAEYLAAFYRIANEDGPDKYGFPVTAFKKATVGASRFYPKTAVNMTALRQFMFVSGVTTKADPMPLVEIAGEPQMREDVVRSSGVGRKPALRFRPMFTEWSCDLTVTFVKSSIDRDSICSLVDAGGLGVGVGEWRPEKGGEFGTFRIDPDEDILSAADPDELAKVIAKRKTEKSV